MVRKLCIACGKKVIIRLKSCTCGHVFAETLLVGHTKERHLRGSDKRMRSIKGILRTQQTPRILKSEVRKYFLSKEKEQSQTVRQNRKPQQRLFEKKGLLLLEERRRKIHAIFRSPQHQDKMNKALRLINKKLLSQKLFAILIKEQKPD